MSHLTPARHSDEAPPGRPWSHGGLGLGFRTWKGSPSSQQGKRTPAEPDDHGFRVQVSDTHRKGRGPWMCFKRPRPPPRVKLQQDEARKARQARGVHTSPLRSVYFGVPVTPSEQKHIKFYDSTDTS